MMIYVSQMQPIRSGLFGLVSQLSWRTSSSSLEEKGDDRDRSIRKTRFSCSFSLLSALCATCTSEGGPVVGIRVRPSCHLPKPVCCDPPWATLITHHLLLYPCAAFFTNQSGEMGHTAGAVITHPESSSVSNSIKKNIWPFFHLVHGLSGPKWPACLTWQHFIDIIWLEAFISFM